MSETPSAKKPEMRVFDLEKEIDNAPKPEYFNGVTVAFSGSDFSILFKLDKRVTHVFKASFTTAKSFGDDLQKAVARFERLTEHQLMTAKEVDDKLKKSLDQ